ncbi:peptidoglycan-binding domain-containing protein, partial [Microcoleus anatoxicus]
KSSWKDGKYLPGESESKKGGFDPKKTGAQVNDVPSFGEAPRLTKAPKKQVPPDLVKLPKPSDDIWKLPPRAFSETNPPEPPNFPDNWFAGPGGGNPKDSDIDIKAAIDYNNAQGYSKDAIKLIQRVVGAAQTGVFGEDTVKKIAGWQSAHRLKRDGKVDPNTLWSIVTELRMRNQP